MKKDKTNFIVAVVIIFTAFLGFPKEIKNIIFTVGALFVLIPAIRDIRRASIAKQEKEFKDTFVESKPLVNKAEISENNASLDA